MHEGTALHAGEEGAIQVLGEALLAEDEPAAGAAQGLVGGGGDEVGVGNGAGVVPGGHQAGDVGHVDHHEGAHLVRDGAEGGEVEGAGVGGSADDDELGLVLQGQAAHLVHVDLLGLPVHVVPDELVENAGAVQGVAVGEVAAVGQVQAQDGVARLQDREVDSHVGLGAAVRLDVGVLGPEELLGAGAGEVLDAVDVDATAVVPAAGVALGVLVGEVAPHGLHHGPGCVVLGSDELQMVALALDFKLQGLEDGRVGDSQGLVHGHGNTS